VDVVVIATAIAVAAVFFISGTAKLADHRGTRQAVRDFGVPGTFASPLGALLPITELLLAALLVVPATRAAGSIGAICLLAVFNIAIAINLSRGRSPECRCFGHIHSAPIGWRTAGRNGGLMLLALAVVLYDPPVAIMPSGSLAAGMVAGSVLAGAVTVVLFEAGTFPIRSRWRKRGAVHTAPPGSPEVVDEPVIPTPVVNPAPAFQLPDAEGSRVSLDDLIRAAIPVVLVFIDPDCDICESIMPDLAWWQRAHGSSVTLQVVGSGPVEQNRAKGARFGISSILVQEDWEVADAYGSETVPSAILIWPDGTIGSAVADGPDEVLNLLSRFTAGPVAARSA
jgi:uncharacterized membrane protein YphA (DoxX/SURF4 family)/peroxiredoxin